MMWIAHIVYHRLTLPYFQVVCVVPNWANKAMRVTRWHEHGKLTFYC